MPISAILLILGMPRNTENNDRVASVRMEYSNTAKKIYINVQLGESSDVDSTMKAQVECLRENGFLAEPVTSTNRKTGKMTRAKGAYRIIFPFKSENGDTITWSELKENILNDENTDSEDGIIGFIVGNIRDDGYMVPQEQEGKLKMTAELIDSAITAINNATNENAAKMIQNLLAKLHTPRVEKMLNSIKVLVPAKEDATPNDNGYTESGSAKFVLSTQAFSETNTMWIIAQWLAYNRTSIPTMIATRKQWMELGREVTANYPLVARMPYRYNGDAMGAEEAEATLGISQQNAYKMDAGVGRAFDRYANFQSDKPSNYTQVVYYDIQDTDIVNKELWDEFTSYANMDNMSHEFNQRAIDLMNDKERETLGQNAKKDATGQQQSADDEEKPLIQDNTINAMLTKKAIAEMVGDNPIFKDTINALRKNSDNMEDILRSFYSHKEAIDREKNAQRKSLLLALCVGVTELALNISMYDFAKNWSRISRYFNKGDLVSIWNMTKPLVDAVRKKQQEYVMAESLVLREFKEFTFDELLDIVGVSPQEFKELPQSGGTTEECSEVKRRFDNLWNRIIEANDKNHGSF